MLPSKISKRLVILLLPRVVTSRTDVTAAATHTERDLTSCPQFRGLDRHTLGTLETYQTSQLHTTHLSMVPAHPSGLRKVADQATLLYFFPKPLPLAPAELPPLRVGL